MLYVETSVKSGKNVQLTFDSLITQTLLRESERELLFEDYIIPKVKMNNASLLDINESNKSSCGC